MPKVNAVTSNRFPPTPDNFRSTRKPDVDSVEGLSPAISIEQKPFQNRRVRRSEQSRKFMIICVCFFLDWSASLHHFADCPSPVNLWKISTEFCNCLKVKGYDPAPCSRTKRRIQKNSKNSKGRFCSRENWFGELRPLTKKSNLIKRKIIRLRSSLTVCWLKMALEKDWLNQSAQFGKLTTERFWFPSLTVKKTLFRKNGVSTGGVNIPNAWTAFFFI